MLYKKLIEDHLEEAGYVLSDGDIQLSYKEIHNCVKQIVRYFKSRDIRKGERIVIVNHNSLETALLIMACIAEGYVFVVTHENAGESELKQIVKDCGACFIAEDVHREGGGQDYLWERPLCLKEDICYILYTSGSSGKSKGIVACQKQVNFCIDGIQERLNYSRTDHVLCCLPLSFDYGLYQLFLTLESGGELFLVRGDLLQKIPIWLQLYNITVFPSMASTVNLLLDMGILKKNQVSFLRMITFTGETLPAEVLKRLNRLAPHIELIPMYGLSECKRVSILPPDRKDKMWEGSCGLPLNHVRVFLEDTDERTGVGELVVEGPNVMEGYWNDKEGTNKVFTENSLNGIRRVKTGDLFRIDQEGFLYFCRRKSRMIKTRGYRFFPQELERQIAEKEGVIECRVIGIPHRIYGEQICICVYLKNREALEAVKEKADYLPEYLHNYRIWVWDEPLPRNKNGKIDDMRIRRMAENDTSILGV